MWPNIKNSRTHQYALKNTQIAPYILCPIQEVFFFKLHDAAVQQGVWATTAARIEEDGEDGDDSETRRGR